MNVILFPFYNDHKQQTILRIAYWNFINNDDLELLNKLQPDIVCCFTEIPSLMFTGHLDIPEEIKRNYYTLSQYYHANILFFIKKERIEVLSLGSFFLNDNQTQIFQMNLKQPKRRDQMTFIYFVSPYSNIKVKNALRFIDEMHFPEISYLVITLYSKEYVRTKTKLRWQMKRKYNIHSATFNSKLALIYEKRI